MIQFDLNKLSDTEKLKLISIIWESIEDKDNSIPVDESHIQLLAERAKTEGKTIPWTEAKEKIENLFK